MGCDVSRPIFSPGKPDDLSHHEDHTEKLMLEELLKGFGLSSPAGTAQREGLAKSSRA